MCVCAAYAHHFEPTSTSMVKVGTTFCSWCRVYIWNPMFKLLPFLCLFLNWLLKTGKTAGESLDAVVGWCMAIVLTLIGFPLLLRGIRKGRNAAFLLKHGIERLATVTKASRTGQEIGLLPLFHLTLEVDDDSGTYIASVDEVLAPEDVSVAIGSTVRVLVHPDDRTQVVITEVLPWVTR
jgi:hypothetical protein